MKILTPEEEAAHNRVTWEGGILGALGGMTVGAIGVYGAGRRFQVFRQLSLPFRAFLITSSTAFSGVITADRASRGFEKARHADSDFVNRTERVQQELQQEKPFTVRAKEWVSEQRYPIVFGSWALSMVVALALVNRNPYATAQQKLVQARVYAQGLTLGVLVASFALESNDLRAGKGRWETVKVLDPDDPEHKRMIDKKIHHEAYTGEDQWMDMLDAQERKMKERGHRTRDSEAGKKGGHVEKEQQQKA